MASDFDQHQLDNDFRQACSLGNYQEVQRNVRDNIVDINVADKYENFTGLHMACEHDGHIEIVKYLLENNANVNCQNALGETPLITILKLDKKKKQSKIDFDRRDKIIELLLSFGADLDEGYSKDIETKSKGKPQAIHCAVILGHINIIRQLLTKNPKLISSQDSIGRYPIHYAAKYNKVFVMQELLYLGSPLEPKDNEGWTPFHIACDTMHIDIVQFILDGGGHMMHKTNNGDQGLHIACRHKVKDIVPIVEFLINQGADQHQTDSKGKNLKSYIKENILLKNVISNAKKKHHSTKNTFPASASSFGMLNVHGNKLYTSTGYKIENEKKLKGDIIVHEHGLVFSYKKGFISKSVIREFHQWEPCVDLISDNSSANTLKIEFGGNEISEHKNEQKTNEENILPQKFGVSPCRPSEITETIQKEIDRMYPTYSLQNEIKQFIAKIGQEKGTKDLIEEYNKLNANTMNSINECDEIEDKSSDRYNRLQSEINTMNARVVDLQNNATEIWNQCETILRNKIEPLIQELSAKIDAMISENQHWKIISNVRKSVTFANEYQEKLTTIKAQIKFIVIRENE